MSPTRLIDQEDLVVEKLTVGAFENNVYLIRDPTQSCCVLIDAAADTGRILQVIGDDRLIAILQTHIHMDHIQALEELRARTQAPVSIHPQELEADKIRPDRILSDGQKIPVGSHEIDVLHTPGHTPGSVSYLLSPDLCFCGDTLFPGGPGKTGSPGSFLKLIQSLEQKIYVLPGHVRLLPGHGEETTVAGSKREYEVFRSKPREETPWGDVLWEET